MVHSEILIIQPGEFKEIKQQQRHIDVLLKQFDPNSSKTDCLSHGLLCYGETQESISSFFNSKHVTSLLGDKSFSKCIMMLHLTDLYLYNDFDTMLRVKISAKQIDIVNHPSILELLLQIADFLSSSRY